MLEPGPQKQFNPFFPLILALVLIAGVFLGTFLNFSDRPADLKNPAHSTNGKIDNILDYIQLNYVDTISRDKLEEKTLVSMLHSLDPHSDYIPASELQEVNEPLQGNFEGIGVEFNILNDTITIVTPISGGPSEKVGIVAGDKIIKVDGKNMAGVKITNKQVFERLRGKHDTKVKISVKRKGTRGLLDFTITRGEIPIYSLDVAYMPLKDIGYIKISRFAANTYDEYQKAFNKLKRQGMKKLIVDLRGNGGGYLNAAVDLADEFLSKGMQIVYTKGKSSPKKQYIATDKGSFENDGLVILIDEGSASASEILAGAVQDNDRGSIIGRRSFGKGLVQEQLELPDGSALRLTTARYYTPSGRCIQKTYKNGNEAYYNEEYDRYNNGELLSADSIHFSDSLKYRTVGGRTVYGGGGIMPDIFVGLDTSYRSSYLTKVFFSGIVNEFSFDYVDKNRDEFRKYKSSRDFISSFSVTEEVLQQFYAFAQKNGVPKNEKDLIKSGSYLRLQLKALIGRNLFNNEAFYPVIHQHDKVMQKALDVLSGLK
ncbi:MAG: S41 family peptidase [Bacteroidia bacterium]